MNKKIVFRILFDITIVVCLVQGWWFIILPLAVIGLMWFPYYFEAVLAGIIFDSLFGSMPNMGMYSYVGTLTMAILATLISVAKKMLRR